MARKSITKTIWVTKDNKRIRVRDMDDQHLINTVKFLHRFANRRIKADMFHLLRISIFVTGEMAQDAIDREMAQLGEVSPEEYCKENIPTYDAMIREVLKRRLNLCISDHNPVFASEEFNL